MDRAEKAATIEEIAAQIEGSEAIFAVDYRGISVSQAAELRGKLREADASFRVVKNRLTKLAAEKVGEERLSGLLDGPTALTFVRGDTAQAAKAISTFNREHDVLVFKGGFMDGLTLDQDKFKSIARLPARPVLDGQLAGVVASPLTGLVRGLGSMIQGLALQLGQIADKGLVSGESPETGDTSEEASQSDSPPPSEGEPEAEQGVDNPPAADAERSTPAETDGVDASGGDEAADASEGDEAADASEGDKAANAEGEPAEAEQGDDNPPADAEGSAPAESGQAEADETSEENETSDDTSEEEE